MARTDNFTNFATDVADSIRSMTGKTGKIPAADFDTEIKSIETKEDLNEELNTYNTAVTEQGVSIDTIINALEGKAAGSGPGNNSAKPLYLIANGYDITDNTGGYTFNQTAGTVTNAVGIKQGTESLNLYTGLWAHCDITFNNDFDVSKYSYLCIDFAYPSTNVIDSMKQYIGIYAHFVTSGTRITLVEGRTTDRVTIRLPLAGVTSPQQIKISCANLSGSNGQNSSAYTEAYPFMIYNVWLEGALSLQDKTIEITENGTTVISPDEGYDGLNNLEVITKVPNSGNAEPEILEIPVDLNTLNKTNISVKQDGTTASYGGWYLYKTIDVENIKSVKFSNVPCYSNPANGLYLYGIVFYDENNNFVSGIGKDEVNEDEAVKISIHNEVCEYLLSSTKDIPKGAKYMDVCSYTANNVDYEPNVILVKVNSVSEVVLQDKVIEINDEYILDITADKGFDGLGTVSIKVNVNNPINKYQMVEYIKGTSYVAGSNYFKTGIYPTSKTTLEMQFAFYKNYNNYSNLYASSRQFLAQTTTADDTRVVALWNGELIGSMSSLNNFNTHIIKQDKNKMYFDGVLKKTCTNAEWIDENELLLFGCPGGQDASAILYYCKIWEDDVLVRDFVPCYRKSDNAVGLLDKVENKFYENAGSVPFEKGPNI